MSLENQTDNSQRQNVKTIRRILQNLGSQFLNLLNSTECIVSDPIIMQQQNPSWQKNSMIASVAFFYLVPQQHNVMCTVYC